ncbi:MAG: M48 family metalloprotease [Planctomycetes bacterium]|nr:M48 family metalloprotease [Planctomycetota bacterium]
MKKLLVILSILAFSSNCAFSADIRKMKHHGSWWIENYGVISGEEDPLVTRAENVFEAVATASDKKGNRHPRLLIIRSKGNPWAISLKDGSIILTHGALEVCYSGVEKEEGDSRLAFLLGHELAHLSNDDFWHAFAFTAVEENLSNKEVKMALKEQLEQTGDIKANDPDSDKFIRTKELHADSYGIISMAIAGYDPRTIVDGSNNFFEDWVSQTTSTAAYEDPRHPGPEMRTEFLRSQLSTVVDIIDYFTFGVNLYQLGRYSDAILLFDAFSEHFPGREVFNNLGLSHYQLSMRFLSSCDEKLAFKFKLSTVFDTETRARKIRGSGHSDCLKNKFFLQHINNAIGYLNLALNKDPTYLPARINLSSALIMAGRYSSAMSVADEVLEIEPGNPDAGSNKAVALYLFGLANNIDTADNAIHVLKETSSHNPGFGNSVYNVAAIQSERGRKTSAQITWKSFLRIETKGAYANAARSKTGAASQGTPIVPDSPESRPPIKLGEIEGKSAGILSTMEHREFIIGKFRGKIYSDNGIKALAIDNIVEVVEIQLDKDIEIEAFKEKHGVPVRIRNNSCGNTLIYSGLAADVKKGKIQKVIYFEAQPERLR